VSVIIGEFVSCHDSSRVGKSSTVGNGRGYETRSNLLDGRTLNRVKDLFPVNILKVPLNLPSVVIFHRDGNTGKDSDTVATDGNGVDGVVGEHGIAVVGKLDTETDDTRGGGTTVAPGGNRVGENQREDGVDGVGRNDLREDVKGEFGIHFFKIGLKIILGSI
jgi:hypothetical protein